MPIDRATFFDTVRGKPFPGTLKQSQVDGMSFILDVWEASYDGEDLRWLAYALATTKWETSSTMQPIEEYGKGQDMKYGKPDPTTGQTYYGRGFVQLTWRENYARADSELGFTDAGSCEWHAENALLPDVAAAIMFQGMMAGWFRSDANGKQTLERYFNEVKDDPYTAREIINGDKTSVPSWTGGLSIGAYIANEHRAFLVALELAYDDRPAPPPAPDRLVTILIKTPPGVRVEVDVESFDDG